MKKGTSLKRPNLSEEVKALQTDQLKMRDGFHVSLAIFIAEETKAVVQIIHGSTEHKARYYEFARVLQTEGYSVVVSDNRGHGASVNQTYPLGFMAGAEEIVRDQVEITNFIKERFPNQDLYLFGHSLGSLFARMYIQQHDTKIKKLILSGAPYYNPAVPLGILLGKLMTACSGRYKRNRLLNWLCSNSKNDSWLSVNQENIARYRQDPLCQYLYTNTAALTVFEADHALRHFKHNACDHPELDILFISGALDPITGGEKGLRHSIWLLQQAGYTKFTNIVYPNMLHEVLHEDEQELVYQDVIAFLNR